MHDDFADNLSFLCSHYPSIAEVCRLLGVNRQQFNKYLAGQSRPSRANMRRICDFFGVTEAEILAEPSQLRSIASVRIRPDTGHDLAGPLGHVHRLIRASDSLKRYEGYYFRYYYSFSNPGRIMKSVARIHVVDGHCYWKNLEPIREDGRGPASAINKYVGMGFLLTNRIYIVEYEAMQANSITQMTLYPSFHSRIGRLIGVQTGGPTRRGRRPGASIVLLEHLGHQVDVRKALYASGLFRPDAPEIPEGVPDMVRNVIAEPGHVLEAEEP
jgi:transcriptional regulator with XRE-family HTH domain